MRIRVLTIVLGLTSVISYGQKEELKTAEKAIKKQDYSSAIAAIKSAESLIANADEKSKSKFYFLKGQAYMGTKDYKMAAEAFNQLIDFEKQTGKERHSDDAKPMQIQIVQEVYKKATEQYQNKDYKKSSENFYLTYKLSPQDTIFIYNAAVSSTLASDYDAALGYYKELQDLGYTGIQTMYFATNKETGVKENLGSKTNRDIMVKSEQYIKPVEEKSESKVGEITKNVAYILKEQGKTEEAIVAIEKAREAFPKDLNLILAEADLYIQLKQMDKFGQLMELAVAQDPTNPTLFFNLGVVNQDQKKIAEATKYYKKAIELKSDYGDAYMNLAVLTLDKEKPIIEEMNKNLSDFDKYDKLLEKQKGVFREALPYLLKADEYGRSVDTVRTLMNIYDNLGDTENAKKYRAIYEKLKG